MAVALSRPIVTPPLSGHGGRLDGGVVPLSQGGGDNLLIHLRYDFFSHLAQVEE